MSIQTVVTRALGRGIYPHQLWWILELPWRRALLSPAQLIKRLALRSDMTVLEIGPGSGYYSRHVAAGLSKGRLLLGDVQREMLARNRARCSREVLARVLFVTADASRLPLADASVNLVYMVTVFGEVPDQVACLREIKRVLRQDGTVSISQHLPDPDFQPLSRLRSQLERAGFAFIRRQGPAWAYTATFRVAS